MKRNKYKLTVYIFSDYLIMLFNKFTFASNNNIIKNCFDSINSL